MQRLLAFARRQPLQPSAVDVAELVRGLVELIASTVGPQIAVVVDVPEDVPRANADPNQLEMAILNLSVNARDAMARGGTLRITATSETVLDRADLAPGRYVRVSVADTGTGMDEATLHRAIEPFFSTKGVARAPASACRWCTGWCCNWAEHSPCRAGAGSAPTWSYGCRSATRPRRPSRPPGCCASSGRGGDCVAGR